MSCRAFTVFCLSAWLMFQLRTVTAQDRVTYTPEGAARPLVAIGEIQDFTGLNMLLRTGTATQQIPSDRIDQIETAYSREHLEGQQLLQRGENEAAIRSLRLAVEREPRTWVDREILALIVQAELRQQDLAGAIHDFLTILETDPVTRHWGIAPLIWSPQRISDALRIEMQKNLTAGDGARQLLAASVLLLDPVQGEAAERTLHSLSRSTNPVLSAYARSQLWRLELASRQIHDVTLERWRDQIDHLPRELRPGPQYLYSRAFEVTGDLRAAAAEALWLPLVYSQNEVLSARALFDAAESLSRTGLNMEAQTLYRELVVRYPWSREATLARSMLE